MSAGISVGCAVMLLNIGRIATLSDHSGLFPALVEASCESCFVPPNLALQMLSS